MDRASHKNRTHNNYDLSADLARIKSALSSASQGVRGRAGEMFAESYQNAKQKSSDLQNNAAHYIADRPFKTLGIAVLAGIVIGYFIRK